MTNDSLIPLILSGLVLFVWFLMGLYYYAIGRHKRKAKRAQVLKEWYDEEN